MVVKEVTKLGKNVLTKTGNVSKKGLNMVSGLGKKTLNKVYNVYEYGTLSIQGNVIQAILVLFFIIYSGIIVKYCGLPFLQFFENIIVKVVVLIIIAFTGIYSPAVALFLAISLIVTLQMAQKKKLLNDLEIVQEISQEPVPTTPMVQEQTPQEKQMQENMTNPEVMSQPLGYNNDASCVGTCGGNNGNPATSSQCGVVKTWENQMSAQGLDYPPGPVDSVGYPVSNNH